MAEYIALIHQDPGSDFGVSFPDFPGCITAGATIEEARRLAAEALAMHVAGMIEDGEEVPAPSPMAAVMHERENRDAVAFFVTLPEREERHERIQVSMPPSLVREIDERTDNRSKFLTDAARAALKSVSVEIRGATVVRGEARVVKGAATMMKLRKRSRDEDEDKMLKRRRRAKKAAKKAAHRTRERA